MNSLLRVLAVFQGKATYRNLSRYSGLSEKTFSRWYRRAFDFALFNGLLLELANPTSPERIAAIDASFMSKSGKKTEGLAMFYNGSIGQTQRGLELSLVCLVDMAQNTAYSLEAKQTIDQADRSRVDLYANQLVELAPQLQEHRVRYVAADAYYSKKAFVGPVLETHLNIVGKLRVDADLKWPHVGQYPGKGRPRKYDGKVDFEQDLQRFEFLGADDEGIETYTGIVYCSLLEQPVRLVMLRWQRGDKVGRVLLYSTDTKLDAGTIIRYYKARFQIEFLFRDAKQHTGLTHCQSRSKKAIHTQINASLTTLNLLKIEDRIRNSIQGETVISIASLRRRKFNQHLMRRLFSSLAICSNDEKVEQVYRKLSDYGAIAA